VHHDHDLDASAAVDVAAVSACIAGRASVKYLTHEASSRQVEHVSARMADQAPNCPLELVTVPVPARNRKAVVGDLVAPRVGLVHHVDEQEQASVALTSALVTEELIVRGNQAVVPCGYHEVAPRVLLTERDVGDTVLGTCCYIEVRDIRVGDVGIRFPEPRCRVLQTRKPFGDYTVTGCFKAGYGLDLPRAVGLIARESRKASR